MQNEDVLAGVRSVVTQTLPGALPDDTSAPLRASGLDSLASVELALNLEDHFGLYFNDDDLRFENFASIDSIVALISGK